MLNVEYRLAPDHKMPAQMDDGLAVVRWLKKNKQTFGKKSRSYESQRSEIADDVWWSIRMCYLLYRCTRTQ